ncbi:haloacid dehalogenase [Altererythrobacter sp. B11]|uniref:HAD family hydrolase n=1 Tax=Altererythrobacter sp. B11 TaxID=2060312 RepID=UPI000DC74205|nr:HAD-IB family hydrolase [Altererythrobacter sp. B11]BBC72984.1 haloacid dehalogenase [Altererythrobacter sp. B11]
MTAFALYDLDKTVLRRASFTPFLIFAARRAAPWRVLLLAVWLLAMAAYKVGLCSRGALKGFGLRLFLGGRVTEARLRALGEAFADHVVPGWIAPGAARAMEQDRAEGRELVLVTAAMHFYAEPIARRLGFADILATRHHALDPHGACRIDGENCYGPEKPLRVAAFLAARGLAREACTLRFYSDSASDAPLFDWVDEAVLVDPGPGAARMAAARGWRVARFAQEG